jgi:hypothetical protein
MLNAAVPKPAPPMYNLPPSDPVDSSSDNILSDLQYMCLGALFGMLGTLLYWRCAQI